MLRRISVPTSTKRCCAALAIAHRSASLSGQRTYFDILDSWWNSSANAAPAVSEAPAMPWFDSALVSVRDTLGVESWVVLVAFGALVRLCTLYFSLYGERAAVRMQCALPQLKPAHEDFQRVYYNDNSTALEVQQAATVLKGVRKSIYKKHQTSNTRALAGLLGSPFVLQGFYSVSKLCENGLVDVGTSSFYWCTALVFPDPMMILPILSCGLTLLNFELTLSSRRNGIQEGVQKNIVWAARGAAICSVSAVAQFRSGVLLYWIGMNLAGLLQPLLVRSTAFKKFFGIPEIPAEKDSHEDLMLRRLTVQAPYLSHLFESDNETNVSMVKPSEASTVPKAPPRKPLTEGMMDAERAAFRKAQQQKSTTAPKGAQFARSSSWNRSNDGTIREEDLLPESLRK